MALAGVGLAVIALTACGKGSDQRTVPPATEAAETASTTAQASGAGPTTSGGLVVEAPTDLKAPPPGTAVIPNPNAPAEAVADNAKVAELAKQFEADPAAVSRQNAICGPADQVLDGLYAQSHGVMTNELRRFRVACMAKDAAQREGARKAAGAGDGVKNTGSL